MTPIELNASDGRDTMGWVIVEFPERREVLCGGRSQGFNQNELGQFEALLIGDGLQTFRLGGPLDFEPDPFPVVVDPESNLVKPQRVVFKKRV